MRKHLNEIDNLFSEGLQHLTDDPSSSVWDHIDRELNRKEALNTRRKYRQLKRVSIVLALLVITLTLVDIQSNIRFNKSTSNPAESKAKALSDIPIRELAQSQPDSKSIKAENKSNAPYDNANPYYQPKKENDNQNAVTNIPFATVNLLNPLTQPASTSGHLPLITTRLERSGNSDLGNPNSDEKNIEHVKLKGHRFSLSVLFSADFIGNRLNEEYEYDNQRQSDIQGRENDDLSFTAGLSLHYDFSRKWFLFTGLSFSNTTSWINPVVLNARADNSGAYRFKLVTTYGLGEITKPGNSNPVNGDSMQLNSTLQELNYITLPIGAGYTITKGKFSLALHSAVGLNLITKGVINVTIPQPGGQDKEFSEKISGLRKGFITAIAGGTLGYSFKEKWQLNFGPVLRYAVTPINEGTPIKNYPNNLGLILGLTAKF